jgi:hypothetical protein
MVVEQRNASKPHVAVRSIYGDYLMESSYISRVEPVLFLVPGCDWIGDAEDEAQF